MLTAKFEVCRDCIELSLSGHADSASYGRDLVCASASILAYTVAQSALSMDQRKALREPPEIHLEPGDSYIRLRPKQQRYHDCVQLFAFAHTGYRLLAHKYPDYVRVLYADPCNSTDRE